MKKLLVILTLAFATFVLGAAHPGAARADSTAVAVNTKDGSSVFRFAFAVRRVMGNVVDESNAAVAVASCTSCQTTAIAIEVVLVMDDAQVITPTNLALAYNLNCDLCVTVAEAYQYVFSTGGAVHFTAQGNYEIAQLRREFQSLRQANLSPDELQARIDALVARLEDVLTNELVAAGADVTKVPSGTATTGTDTTKTPPPAPPPPPPPPPAPETTSTQTTTEPTPTTTETTTTTPTDTTTTTTETTTDTTTTTTTP